MLDLHISERLTSDDDPGLWQVATEIILSDAIRLSQDAKESLFVEIGCCRHWITPHQMRWLADGGFAWPFGYDRTTTGFSFAALPSLEWSIVLTWTGREWLPQRTGRKYLLLRIAIPGRTARHQQAAIHTVWTRRSPSTGEKTVQLYGFRKKRAGWRLTAAEVLRPRKRPKGSYKIVAVKSKS